MGIIKDFEFSPETKQFRLYQNDPFTFEAAPQLPLGLADMARQLTVASIQEHGIGVILDFFDGVLLESSAAEIRRRASDKTMPFGPAMLRPVLMWLLEEYGLRPTEPSSSSSSTSLEGDGMSLTAGAQAEESTPSDSPSLASST